MEAKLLLREPKQQLLKQLPATHEVIFKWFLALTEVYRPSYHLDEARKTCMEWGKKLGAEVKEDEAGNILLSIPASKGHENVKPICIQGHLDIVAVGKFDEQGQVFLKIEDGKLTSGISSIGADDGIAVATMFAVIELRDTFEHGQIECLITLDEEVGLLGAAKLAGPPFIQSRALLNIDSEDWGVFFTSCAGGMSCFYELPIKKEKSEGEALRLEVSGFLGGHTGLTIHEGRSNAVKWMDRLLQEAKAQGVDFHLVSIDGGEKHNAIPDKCVAVVVTKDAAKLQEICKKVHEYSAKEAKAIEKRNPTLKIEATKAEEQLDAESTTKVLDLLASIYHGVWEMHPEIKGVVRTSQSMSITRTEADKLFVQVYARSNEATMMSWLKNQNEAVARLANCPIRIPPEETQRPWPAALSARVTEVAQQAYKNLFGNVPEITAIHAGLECGCIQERGYPDMECVSFGPDLHGAHSLEESVTIDSTCKCFDLTLEILKMWTKE
jgi:dipeptidase D